MKFSIRQPQPVETSMEEEEVPPLQLNSKNNLKSLSEESAQTLLEKLTEDLKSEQQSQFENGLKGLNKFFALGYTGFFLKESELHKKMMSQFIKLSKQLQKNSQAESKMLFILSLIAEMIKESPKFYFSFTRKFLLTVFEIDNQSLENSPYKNQILAILSVIYHNLSMQGRLIKKLNLEKELKNALLTNYYLINQLFTLKLFNRSILNLASKLTFTSGEFSKYGILQTISKFIAQNQVEIFLARMKTCMFEPKSKPQQHRKMVA